MAFASRGVCELDERFVSSKSPNSFSSASFLDDEQMPTTHFPNTHKTKRAVAPVGREIGVDKKYLDGG